MPYATAQDLIDRFGTEEMTLLTTPGGEALNGVVTAKAERAIADASALIDSYLRVRYDLPLSATPPELVGCASVLARFDLAHGDGRTPTDQMAAARKEKLDWLKLVAEGKADLALADADLPAAEAAIADGMRVQDRPPAFISRDDGGL